MKKLFSLFITLTLLCINIVGANNTTAAGKTKHIVNTNGNGKHVVPWRNDKKIISAVTLDDDFAPGCVIVVLKQSVSILQMEKRYTANDFVEIDCIAVDDMIPSAKSLVHEEIRRRTAVADGKMRETDLAKLSRIEIEPEDYRAILKLTLKDKSKKAVIDALDALNKRDDVYCASPNVIMHNYSTYPYEWNKTIDGGRRGARHPDGWFTIIPVNNYTWTTPWEIIDAPDAWDKTRGSDNMKIGVIDSGVSHDDISINSSLSKSFISNSYEDDLGHGTHVAGIIGAKANNEGITGVCWFASIAALKIIDENNTSLVPPFDTSTSCFDSFILALNWMNDNEITLANASLGWDPSQPIVDPNLGVMPIEQSVVATLQSAVSSYNGLLICAAGNDGPRNIDIQPLYPAALPNPNIITVGNSTVAGAIDINGAIILSGDENCLSSNIGNNSVDLFAPGTGIMSAFPDSLSEEHVDIRYVIESGTSMAAPFVTGVAALIKSRYPLLSSWEIKKAIMDGVDKIPALNGLCVTGGRLNAYKALECARVMTAEGYNMNHPNPRCLS